MYYTLTTHYSEYISQFFGYTPPYSEVSDNLTIDGVCALIEASYRRGSPVLGHELSITPVTIEVQPNA